MLPVAISSYKEIQTMLCQILHIRVTPAQRWRVQTIQLNTFILWLQVVLYLLTLPPRDAVGFKIDYFPPK